MTVYLHQDKVSKAAFLIEDSTQTSMSDVIQATSAYDQYNTCPIKPIFGRQSSERTLPDQKERNPIAKHP